MPFGLGTTELMIFGLIAVLLFGKRLPEVARSLGSSYREFRSGLMDIQRQLDVRQYLNDDVPTWSSTQKMVDEAVEPKVPKFDLPAAATTTAGETPSSGEASTDASSSDSAAVPEASSAASEGPSAEVEGSSAVS